MVDNARAAKSDLKLVIGNVPSRSFIGGREDLPIITREYNSLLAEALPGWATSSSPVGLVHFRETYSCETTGCPAGYDGLHPNSLGEYQIASAVSQTLYSTFQLGSGPLAVPDSVPQRNLPAPSNLNAVSLPLGVAISWDKVYGATSYYLESRVKGVTDFEEDPKYPTGSATTQYTTWTVDGIEWEYRVRSSYGDTKSAWTGIASAVAHPETAPGPRNIVVQPGGTGFDIFWDPPEGSYNIDRYELIYWDRDTPGAFIQGYGTRGRTTSVEGLNQGHRYLIWVATWTNIGGGLPAGANGIVVGGGTPPMPTNLQVFTTNGYTVKITWDGSPWAAGYRVYTRNINNATDYLKTDEWSKVTSTCHGITYLFPGAWNYEFCVVSFNGDLESSLHNCVTAPETETPEAGDCPIEDPGSDDGTYPIPDDPVDPVPEPVESPPDPSANCAAVPSFFALPGTVGEIDHGLQFCAAKWNAGVFPNLIEARADKDALRYLRIRYTDGSEITQGVAVADDGHSRYGTIEWDPWKEHFDRFSLWAGGWNNGVGRIVMEMAKHSQVDAGKYWDPNAVPVEILPDRGTAGQGMLLGFFGAADDAIDALQPYFSKSAPDKVILRDFEFTPTWEQLNSRPFAYVAASWSGYKLLTANLGIEV